jgi:hypothetical protein
LIVGLLLCSLVGTPRATAAQDREERLEEWQRRILEAIEASGRGEGAPSQDAWRGTLDDEAAAAAARKARKRHGGRVLAVGRVGDAYRVRLLLDDGRVITVEVAE